MKSTVEQHGTAVRVRVRVQPRAATSRIVGELDGALRVRLAAPPVDGAANEELARFIGKRLRLAPSRISIVAGATGRNKVIEIADAVADTVRHQLVE